MNASRYPLMLLRTFLFCFAGELCACVAAWLDTPSDLARWIFVSNGLGAVAALDLVA